MEKIIYEPNKVILKNEDYFHIQGTLDCGQAFRWNGDENAMMGVVGGTGLTVERKDKDVIITGCHKDFFDDVLYNYFDLGYDYPALITSHKDDERIVTGAKLAYGLRMLNQDKFETLLSFIISANNNVQRIKGIIARLCQTYGEEIGEGIYSFPSPDDLRDVKTEDYAALGAGYRASYLESTVKSICDGYDLNGLEKMDYKSARKEICKLKGVGPKVADCILLYSCGFRGAFPVDVHIGRIMEQLYFDGKKTDKKVIEAYAAEHFGDDAGIIQLFLFHYARKFSLTIG